MFDRNYLSRIIRYSTQNAYWGRTSDRDTCKAASRIGRLRDSRRPRKLTEEQSQQARRKPTVLALHDARNQLRTIIVAKFGVIKLAEGEQIHKQYQDLARSMNSTIRAEERALLKRIQEEYDDTTPMLDIQLQLNGEVPLDEDSNSESEAVLLKFAERRRIAEVALTDPSTFAPEKGFGRHIDFCTNLTALCKRIERRRPRTGQGRPMTTDDPIILPNSELEGKRSPLQCVGAQCLFCLTSTLSSDDKGYVYASKCSLQRHADRCRLNQFKSDEAIPCPDRDACAGVILEGKMHFKNHASRVHNFIL